MNNPWITTKTDVIYDNPWIQLTHNEVINPSGNLGIYGKVHFKNYAIAIVPLDENYNTWIVGQYRYTINQYSWEVPEGGGSLDLSPLESAQRELLEETGITAKNWQCVIEEMYLSNSVTDEKGMVFVAKDLSFGIAEPEETEQLQIKKIPFKELVSMAISGKITDAFALIAIFKVQIMIDQGLL